MVKSFRYVFKRILIGVGIALVLSYLRGTFLLGVSAKEISGAELPGTSYNFGTGTTEYTISYDGNAWANWGVGYLYFDFAISTRSQATPTSPFAYARSVIVWSSNHAYICEVGTVSVNNSTFVATTYSAKCPMSMGTRGLDAINFKFGSVGSDVESLYNLTLTGVFTYEQADSVIVNVPDTSSNDNRNTQMIISNNNTNTQNIINSQQETTDAIEDLNDSINDDTGVANNDISDLFGDLESSDTPISDLLTMPLTLINAYISGMSGTCQSISLGRLYGSLLVIPCINLQDKLGSDLWATIDILFSLFMIYNLSQLFISAFDGITSLNDDFQSLYGARHVASPKTRVERNSDLY